jgi:hypothetical protein
MAVYTKPVYETPNIQPKLSRYERVLLPLMEEPGVWGKIGEYKTSSSAYQAALNLANGKYKIPGDPQEWEFVSDENAVFARYVVGTKDLPKKVTKKATKSRVKK